MENEQIITEEPEKRSKIVLPGESYPVETVRDALNSVDRVVSSEGTSKPISKEKISEIVGKKISTLGLTFSTWNQYQILITVRGEGYKTTPIYKKYLDKTYPQDERDAMLQMFKSPELYSKIIENLDGHILPAEEKFANILQEHPYNINKNSAPKAAKIFYENLRDLNLLEKNNKLVFNAALRNDGRPHSPEQKSPPKTEEMPELAKYEFPLTDNKKAILQYPTKAMSIEDFDIMTMAIELLAKTKKLSLQIELKKGANYSPEN